MRMRAKKWVKPELEICPYYIQNPLPLRGQWRSLFPKEQPFHVELGCGKGFATAKMARETPEVNFLAVDLCSTVLGVCLLYTSPSPRDVRRSRMPSSA